MHLIESVLNQIGRDEVMVMKEIQMISVAMWCLDNVRTTTILDKLDDLFAKRTDEFMATVIYGSERTKNKNCKYDATNTSDNDLYKACLQDEKIYRVVLTNSDRKKREVLFGFIIDFAYFATVITFEVTHSYFKTEVEKEKYMSIVKELIEIVSPFYGNIDDIGESLEILKKAGEDTYICVTDYVPAIYWGNYFGEKYVTHYGKDKLLDSPYGIVSNVGNGIFITMNDDPMNYNTKECAENRKRLSRYLQVGKPNPIKKLFGF